MESQWIKPIPIKVKEGKVRGRLADVLHTNVESRRVIFYLDKKTHLPHRVRLCSASELRECEGSKYSFVDLDEYVLVDGIQMPRKVSWEGGAYRRFEFQINVEYEPQFFDRSLSLENYQYAWKPKVED